MSKKVYGFCDAGCKYEVATPEDLTGKASIGDVHALEDRIYALEIPAVKIITAEELSALDDNVIYDGGKVELDLSGISGISGTNLSKTIGVSGTITVWDEGLYNSGTKYSFSCLWDYTSSSEYPNARVQVMLGDAANEGFVYDNYGFVKFTLGITADKKIYAENVTYYYYQNNTYNYLQEVSNDLLTIKITIELNNINFFFK